MDATVAKGKNFTAVLTAIKDPLSLQSKIHGEQNINCNLIKDDFPSSEKDINGFHLLMISPEGEKAFIINNRNKDIAQRTMQNIIQAELSKTQSS